MSGLSGRTRETSVGRSTATDGAERQEERTPRKSSTSVFGAYQALPELKIGIHLSFSLPAFCSCVESRSVRRCSVRRRYSRWMQECGRVGWSVRVFINVKPTHSIVQTC